MSTKTITHEGFIVFDVMKARHPSIWPTPFDWVSYNPGSDSDSVVIRPHSITFDVPEDFDPRKPMVDALEARKRKLQAEFTASITAINRQISELTAIEYGEAE